MSTTTRCRKHFVLKFIFIACIIMPQSEAVQCMQGTLPNFTRGEMFAINYCKAYGDILSSATNEYKENVDKSIISYQESCSCVHEDFDCKVQVHDPAVPCGTNKICCRDRDLAELKDGPKFEKSIMNSDHSDTEDTDYNKCYSHPKKSSNNGYPWYAVLKSMSKRRKMTTKCAAIIIHPMVILTDKYCVSGSEKLYTNSDDVRGRELTREKKSFKFMSLVKLKTALNFSESLRAACLPSDPKDVDDDKDCTLLTTHPASANEVIMLASTLMQYDTCLSGLTSRDKHAKKHEGVICTKFESTEECKEKHTKLTSRKGAPLLCESRTRPGRFSVAGLVAHMYRCDGELPLEFFSDVAGAVSWIKETFKSWGLDTISFTL